MSVECLMSSKQFVKICCKPKHLLARYKSQRKYKFLFSEHAGCTDRTKSTPIEHFCLVFYHDHLPLHRSRWVVSETVRLLDPRMRVLFFCATHITVYVYVCGVRSDAWWKRACFRWSNSDRFRSCLCRNTRRCGSICHRQTSRLKTTSSTTTTTTWTR